MNKKIKTITVFGVGFFVGMYAFSVVECWLCSIGKAYIYLKEGGHEYGDRKIVPPTSGRYHWNSDSEEEETPE